MAAIDTAHRLIAKKGRDVLLRRNVGTDPVENGKPWLGVQREDDDFPTRAVFLGTAESDALLALGAGRVMAAVKQGATSALVAAKGLPWEPDEKTRIVDGERVWSVLVVDTLRPGDETILYTFALRG